MSADRQLNLIKLLRRLKRYVVIYNSTRPLHKIESTKKLARD